MEKVTEEQIDKELNDIKTEIEKLIVSLEKSIIEKEQESVEFTKILNAAKAAVAELDYVLSKGL